MSKDTIELIETQSAQAKLGDVLIYCKELKVNIEQLVPELLEIKEHLIK